MSPEARGSTCNGTLEMFLLSRRLADETFSYPDTRQTTGFADRYSGKGSVGFLSLPAFDILSTRAVQFEAFYFVGSTLSEGLESDSPRHMTSATILARILNTFKVRV